MSPWGPCAAIREEPSCGLLSSELVEGGKRQHSPQQGCSPKPSHTSAHVWMEGPTSGSSLRVTKLLLASILELWGGSHSAQPSAGAVGSLCCVEITHFAVCSAWEHMALSGLFVCFRVFLFLSILVYCHK